MSTYPPGRSLSRRHLPNPLAASFRVFIQIGVHRIGKTEQPKALFASLSTEPQQNLRQLCVELSLKSAQ